jgi:hypothetical protein
MTRLSTLQAAFAALILGFTFSACETIPGLSTAEPQGEPRAKTVLTAEQVARQFFEAYKKHDRAAAAKLASPQVINKLHWDPKAGKNTTLELQETDKGDWAILYEGGWIELEILGDGHVGSHIVDVKMHAD